MRLDAANIADLARDAGFLDRRLHVATAVALASSGGITHYRYDYGIAGAGRQEGLWAIDIDQHPGYADWPLHEPHTAAQAAYELTQHHDGFGWSPVYEAGSHAPYLAHAATEASKVFHAPTRADDRTPHAGTLHHDDILGRIRKMRADIVDRPRPGGRRWQQPTR